MADRPTLLNAGFAVSDRMLPILLGQVRADDVTLVFETGTPSTLFWRALHEGAFDVTEMSLAAHAILTSRDANPFVGLPVFTSRMFRHGTIFVSAASGIEKPEDLAGRRIGVPEYQMTAAVWMRGILEDQYGVRARDVHWITGGVNTTGRRERIALRAPADVVIEAAPEDLTLNALLLDGGIDAIMAPQIPDAFRQGDARVRRLFAESRKTEEAYFAATGVFPIMHLAVLRRELANGAPELPHALTALFEAAKDHAAAALCDADAPAVMLPWQVDAVEQTRAIMGADYWPYGIEANRHALSVFLRYLDAQGLLARPLSVDDLFAA